MVTKTQLERLGLFDAKVPRYTSYPTAPHFSDAIGSGEHASWIEVPLARNITLKAIAVTLWQWHKLKMLSKSMPWH